MKKHRVKINDNKHVYLMGMMNGMHSALEKLEDLPDNLRATPGFTLAMATVRADAAEMQGMLITRNMTLLAEAGVNIAQFKSLMFDPETNELVCEIYDEGEVE